MFDRPDKDLFEDRNPAIWRLLGAWLVFPVLAWLLWWEVSGWESSADLPARLVSRPYGTWVLFGLFAAVCVWIVVKFVRNREDLPPSRFQRATMILVFVSLSAITGSLGYGALQADKLLQVEQYRP